MSRRIDDFRPQVADRVAFLNRGKGISSPDVQSAIEEVARKTHYLITESQHVKVPTDFVSINEAIKHFSHFKITANVEVVITLEKNFVIKEQVFINNRDLGFIRIVSEDETVTVDPTFLTQSPPILPGQQLHLQGEEKPVFSATNGAVLPVIDFLMDGSMTEGNLDTRYVGVYIANNSFATIAPGGGAINFKGDHSSGQQPNSSRGLFVVANSFVTADGSIWDGCAIGVYVASNSSVRMQSASVQNCIGGVYVNHLSTADCRGVKANNCGRNGLYVNQSSIIYARFAEANNCGNDFQDSSLGSAGVYCSRGSKADIEGITAKNCYIGLNANHGATVNASAGANFSFANYQGIACKNGSTVNAHNSDISNASQNAIQCDGGSTVNVRDSIIKNAGNRALQAEGTSFINARNADLSNGQATESVVKANQASTINVIGSDISNAFNHAIHADNASKINAQDANLSNAGGIGALALNGSTINALNANTSNYGDNGIQANSGSTINARGANCRKEEGVDNPTDIRVLNGAIINASGAIGGLSQEANEITKDGVIFK